MLDAGEGGAEVLLGLDVSGSMAPNVEDLQAVALDFLDRLRPIDKVTVAGFNSAFFVIAGRDTDRATRRRAIGDLNASGGTAIYDTLVSAADLVGQQPGRRAVVLFRMATTYRADRRSRRRARRCTPGTRCCTWWPRASRLRQPVAPLPVAPRA
jgi:Mg-chelatase subunit ChlD